MKKWNMVLHMAASALFGIVVQLLWGLKTTREAAAIGVIGSADGPTAVFISGKSTIFSNPLVLKLLFSVFRPAVLAFIAAMLFYIPVKRLITKK